MPSTDPLALHDRKALDEYVSRLRDELRDQIFELRLFGSKARGTSSRESDIDVLVVLESLSPDLENRVVDLAFDVNLEHGVFISPVVFSREVRESRLWRFTDFGKATEREGIAL